MLRVNGGCCCPTVLSSNLIYFSGIWLFFVHHQRVIEYTLLMRSNLRHWSLHDQHTFALMTHHQRLSEGRRRVLVVKECRGVALLDHILGVSVLTESRLLG